MHKLFNFQADTYGSGGKKYLKSYTLLWAILAIVGLYGALMYSAIFFGIFTVGLFLIFCNSRTEEKNMPTPTPIPVPPSASVTSLTCPNCGAALEAGAVFCPRCGGKVRRE